MQSVRSTIVCLGLLVLAWSSTLRAETTQESVCKPSSKPASLDAGGYTASCASKPDCTTADTLVITWPKSVQAPAGICLRIGETFVDLKLPALDNAKAASEPAHSASFVLGNELHDALYGKDGKAIAEALKKGTDPRQDIAVVVTDKSGQSSQKTVRLDTTALWTAGLLKLRPKDALCESGPACKVGDRLAITLPGLAAWATAVKADPGKLVLVINDVRMVGLTPVWRQANDVLMFRLQRLGDKADNLAAWALVLPDLTSEGTNFKVGLADEKVVVTSEVIGVSFTPWMANRMWAALSSLLITTVLAGLLLRRNHGLWIRDDNYGVPDQAFTDAGIAAPTLRPFSLGRSQMLFWTFAVTAATVAIGSTTGAWLSISNTALVLLGLGVGTALGSVAAGVPKAISDALNTYNMAPAGTPQRTSAATALCTLVTSTGNWFKDVSSEYGDARAGVHRLQSMIATLGFGAFFVWRAFSDGVMPTFTDTQLALLGISGSAYVGFKLAG